MVSHARLTNVMFRLAGPGPSACPSVRGFFVAASRGKAEHLRDVFTLWCRYRSYDAATETLERDWERMTTFYDFPKEH